MHFDGFLSPSFLCRSTPLTLSFLSSLLLLPLLLLLALDGDRVVRQRDLDVLLVEAGQLGPDRLGDGVDGAGEPVQRTPQRRLPAGPERPDPALLRTPLRWSALISPDGLSTVGKLRAGKLRPEFPIRITEAD